MRTLRLRLPGELSKTILRLLGLMTIIGTLSSCIPAPHGAYYKPSYPDNSATLERGVCGGSVGPFSVLKLPTPDGYITVTLEEDRQDHLELWMWLHASGFSTLQFTSNVLRLKDLDKDAEWTVEVKSLNVGRSIFSGPISYDEVVDFSKVATTAPENVLEDLQVTTRVFKIEDFSPDIVLVHLPRVIVNGDEHVVPPVLIEADKESDNYRRWGWWPYKWKAEKIAGLTIGGAATGGAKGSLKIDPRLQLPEFGGSIGVSFPAVTKWRFVSNEISFEDAESGEVRRIQFTHLQPWTNTMVDFTAPFCCSRNAIMLGLPIGDARPTKLRMELPALLINGKEFAIKPVTFELRRFEFGIYPLNC